MPGFDFLLLKGGPRAFWMVVLLGASVAYAGPPVRFVDDDAAPGGDGLAWNTAYQYLQDALIESAAPQGATRAVSGESRHCIPVR